MEILLWLVPAAVATLVAMTWVAWWGREGRGEVDRETAARRLGEALARERGSRPGYAAVRRPVAGARDGAVAVRSSPPAEPAVEPVVQPPAPLEPEVRVEAAPQVVEDDDELRPEQRRRAS